MTVQGIAIEEPMQGRSLTVEPVWAPYRLDNVIGAFGYRDGEVKLTDVQTTPRATLAPPARKNPWTPSFSKMVRAIW